MHGLTGGSWKRSGYRAMATEKNNPTGNRAVPNGSVTYHRTMPPRQLSTLLRYGNSARHFDKIMGYARMRLAGVIAKRHRRSRAFGWSVIAFQSPNYLGLINLDGTVAAPRPFRAWRERPNAGGERRR
jgi:hypothetical protein